MKFYTFGKTIAFTQARRTPKCHSPGEIRARFLLIVCNYPIRTPSPCPLCKNEDMVEHLRNMKELCQAYHSDEDDRVKFRFPVRICLLTLSARLITQTAVSIVNELGTSMGPWYWLDGCSESSHCEFATFALKPRWIRIRCGNSSLLDSRINRERSSEFISVTSLESATSSSELNFARYRQLNDPRTECTSVQLTTCVGALKFVRISSYLEQAISSGYIAKRSKSTKNIKLDRSLDAVWPRPNKTMF